jgi:valyl-tRNA synthetase
MLIVELFSKLKFYLELGGSREIAAWILRNLLVLLWPLAPSFTEQLLGKAPEKLPEAASLAKELPADFVYSYITRFLEDLKQVKMLYERKTGKAPRKLYVYVAPEKYYQILEEILEGKDLRELARKYQVDMKFLQKLKKLIYSYNLKQAPRIDEKRLIEELSEYIRSSMGFEEVRVFKYLEDKDIYDPSRKAPLTTPYKPSMWLE